MTAIIASALFFVLAYAAALGIWGMLRRRRPIDRRFSELAREIQFEKNRAPLQPLARRMFEWLARRVPTPDPESAGAERLGQELLQAGITATTEAVNRFYAARVLLALSAGCAGALFGMKFGRGQSDTILTALSAASLTIVAMHYYIKRRARIRQAAIASELSEAVDLLVVAVESGLGLNEALQVVGSEAERQRQQIGRELAIVSSEMSAGKTLGDALRSLADRTTVDELKPLAATLIQSEQLGTQIGPALRASSNALRDARRLRAEEAAQKLAIKVLFPLVMLVLPAMLMLILGPAMLQIVRALGQ